MRRLIVNADDLGLHAGINAGVLRAYREGIVTSASICASGVAFEEAVRAVKAEPGLDLGLHLTLVDEAPLLPAASLPTLAPGGRFPPSFLALFRRLLLRQVRAEEIARELEAQAARARDAGLRISHLDSHQHVHFHPALLPHALRLAKRFGVPALRAAERVRPWSAPRPALLSLFSGRAARQARAAGLRTPDVFLGAGDSGGLDQVRWAVLVQGLSDGTSEVLCHPGQGNAAIGAAYSWGFRWDEETAALTSPALRESLERAGVQLIGYRDL